MTIKIVMITHLKRIVSLVHKLGAHGEEEEIHHSFSVANNRQKHRMFEGRFTDLVALKTKHWHYNTPCNSSSEYYSLGVWCNEMRGSYKQIQQSKSPRSPLSQDLIGRLEALGFEWVGNI